MSFLTTARNAVFSRSLRFAVSLGARPNPQQDEVVQVPSRDAGRTIRVHVYRRQGTETGPSTVLVNFHGSGFVLPLHGSDDEFCRRIRDEAGYTVLDVQYRLAPEHPFPAAADDAEDVVKWVQQQKDQFDPARLAVSGFSAGGNLALGLFSDLLDASTCQHAIIFYAVTDFAKPGEEKHAPDASGRDALPLWIRQSFNSCYILPGTDVRQHKLSPSFIETARFPENSLFVTCAFDCLALEAEELAGRIEATPGKHVKIQRVEKVAHAWDKATKAGSYEEEQKNAAYASAVELLRSPVESSQ